jgi:hypothetical protein
MVGTVERTRHSLKDESLEIANKINVTVSIKPVRHGQNLLLPTSCPLPFLLSQQLWRKDRTSSAGAILKKRRT